MINAQSKNISIITDTGVPTKEIESAIKHSDCLVLESNHDLNMLEYGPYPQYLKQRIAGKTGHLSNEQAKQLVLSYATERLKHLFLAHLSEHNNSHEVCFGTMKYALMQDLILKNIDLKMTYRDKISDIITL